MADSSVKLTLGFAPLASAVQSAVVQGMQHAGEDGKQIARSLARVDKGDMRESIDYEVRNSGASVELTLSVGTDHGLFNEVGTVKMSAQPMIRPGIDLAASRIPGYITSAFGTLR